MRSFAGILAVAAFLLVAPEAGAEEAKASKAEVKISKPEVNRLIDTAVKYRGKHRGNEALSALRGKVKTKEEQKAVIELVDEYMDRNPGRSKAALQLRSDIRTGGKKESVKKNRY